MRFWVLRLYVEVHQRLVFCFDFCVWVLVFGVGVQNESVLIGIGKGRVLGRCRCWFL